MSTPTSRLLRSSVRKRVEDEITHLRGLIERCERLLRSITDDHMVGELERVVAEARERLEGLLGLPGL